MANELSNIINPRRNVGFAGPEGELLDEQAQQGFEPINEPITNQSLMAQRQQPQQNYMQGPSGQTQQFQSARPIQLSGGKTGYLDQQGNVTVDTDQGQMSVPLAKIQANDAEIRRQQELANLQKQAQLHQLRVQAGLAPKEAEKPQFNAEMGGYVYPPSPDHPQGKFVPVQGAQKPEKPLSEFQGKAFSYGARALDSHKILDEIGTSYNPMAANAAMTVENVPGLGAAANAMLSPKDQQIMQAQRSFINATLRQESGATISPSEFANAKRQYFPQPGDSPDVLEQKKANRERVIEGFKVEAGPAGKKFDEISQQATPKARAISKIPATGESRGGYMFLGGNPGDPTRWRKQ